MKQRQNQRQGGSEVERLATRINDLVGGLRLDGILGENPAPPPKPQPAEQRYSPAAVFSIWIPDIPARSLQMNPPCLALTITTGKEILQYATFARVLWKVPDREKPPALAFQAIACPLSQHLCGADRSFCPLKVGGKYSEVEWNCQIGGFILPMN